MNYKVAIHAKLSEVLRKQDGLSVGEKFYSIERELGSSFILSEDSDIYEAMERFISHPVDNKDETLSDEEFNNWVESKFN